jgi:large subunit ribosomal protein L4
VVTAFVEGEAPRTSDALAVLRTAIGLTEARLAANVLVVAESEDELTWKSLRNVPGVRVLAADQLNTYDVLISDHVVFTHAALSVFVGRVSPGSSVALEASSGTKSPAAKDAAPEEAPAKDAPAEDAAPEEAPAKDAPAEEEAARKPAASSKDADDNAAGGAGEASAAKPRTRRASATPKEDEQ